MNVRILESARRDLRKGYDFYERQEIGVGDYFLDTLYSEIDTLARFAGTHSTKAGYFRMLSGIFPYAAYYLIISNEAVVHAVLDCRRDPRRILRRLRAR